MRLTATSPTYGPVTVVIIDEPSQARYYLLCRATRLTAPVDPGLETAELD